MTTTPDSTPPAVPEWVSSAGPLAERLGIRVVEAGPGRVVATMPVEGNTQPFGLLHGGASAALAEHVASLAGLVHAGPDAFVVGLDLSITHHRAARSGMVTAVATPLSQGRTVASYDVRITDDEGNPVATARMTALVRPKA